jgi:hypothetical protein
VLLKGEISDGDHFRRAINRQPAGVAMKVENKEERNDSINKDSGSEAREPGDHC